MSWVMNTYGMRYLSRRSSMRFMTPARIDTSSIDTGSSAMITFGLRTIARAMATRCRWPPDISCGNRSRKSCPGRRPLSSRARTTSSARCSRSFVIPWMSRGSETARRTENRGLRDSYGSWKIIWRSRRKSNISRGVSEAISAPSNKMNPSVGVSSREMSRPVVVFPHPLSPTSPRISPPIRLKLIPSTACT